MPRRTLCVHAAVVGLILLTQTADAATTSVVVDPTNPIVGVIANAIIADGEGDDWSSAVLLVELTSGSVYNDPGFDADGPQQSLWGFVPLLQWDTYAGIPGGASNFGPHCGFDNDSCLLLWQLPSLSGSLINIFWGDTATTATSPVQIANISMTDDAQGTWQMITRFSGVQVALSGPVTNGVMVPEPGVLGLVSVCGLALLGDVRRRTRKDESC